MGIELKDDSLPAMTRRSLLLGGIGFLSLGALASRLYYLQFVHAEKYRTLAEGNRVKLQIIAPERGLILDYTGRPLAENRDNFRLFLDMEKNPDPRATLENLRQWIAVSDRRYQSVLDKLKRYSNKPLLVRDNLNWEEVVAIEHHTPDIPGAFIERGKRRHYPLAVETAHVLGYVGGVSEEEQKAARDFYRWPEAQLGKQGMERERELALRGRPGLRHLEVDVRGLAVKQLDERPSTPGKTLHSSLHFELQKFAYDLLMKNLSGAAIVMDIHSGEVHALASAPSFDSNVMSAGIAAEDWNALRESERFPLLNKATIGQYPPGSVFKMLVGLAALHAGKTTPHRHIHCSGSFWLGNHRFRCWKPGGHGSLNLHHAIAQSCDTHFYTLGKELGIEPIAEMCRRFGLGAPTGIDIPGEKGGLIPTPEWKLKSYGEPWQGGDTVNASIGQGYVLTTPLQLTVMAARMAGGFMVSPTLLKTEGDPPPRELLGLDPAHLEVVRGGMEAVVNKPYGTAYGARIKEPEMAFAGKTGTAQVRKITVQGQAQENLPWNQRHHALFAGYAPVINPRFAAGVLIEHGGGGASTAAPVCRDLLLKTQELLG